MSATQWFVKCDTRDNENLSRLLASHQIGDENMFVGLCDTKGKKHDAWLIPTELLNTLISAKKMNPAVFGFRFFVRDSQDDNVRSARFLELKALFPKGKKAASDLALLQTRESKHQELNDK